jgi:hypothetical protein
VRSWDDYLDLIPPDRRDDVLAAIHGEQRRLHTMNREDVIYFAEQSFSCLPGNPFQSNHKDTKFAQIIVDGDEHHASSCMINVIGDIANRLGKVNLVWRLLTKVDYSDQLEIMRTVIYIDGCRNYGKWRNDGWMPPFPILSCSREQKPVAMLEWKRDPNLVVPVGDDPTTPGAA